MPGVFATGPAGCGPVARGPGLPLPCFAMMSLRALDKNASVSLRSAMVTKRWSLHPAAGGKANAYTALAASAA
eukprot:8815856-Alexandrium_andersonii.AAC.1